MSLEYIIKNNGRRIGKTLLYSNNVKKIIVASVLGVSLVTTTKYLCKPQEYPTIKELIPEEKPLENTYKVDYRINLGDTLTGIVYSYESDANRVYKYVDEISRINHLESPNGLRDGKKITLVGVPESKLNYFGYSSDYSLFPASYELDDRIEFINSRIDSIYVTSNTEADIKRILNEISELSKEKAAYDELGKEDEAKLDYLLEEYRRVCDELKGIFGSRFDFETNKKAHPLSEQKEESFENERKGIM